MLGRETPCRITGATAQASMPAILRKRCPCGAGRSAFQVPKRRRADLTRREWNPAEQSAMPSARQLRFHRPGGTRFRHLFVPRDSFPLRPLWGQCRCETPGWEQHLSLGRDQHLESR